MIAVQDFEAHVEEAIVDPHGIHHEFVSGLHGRKVDFDDIPGESELFDEWIDVTAAAVRQLYPDVPLGNIALVGTANGSNRQAVAAAEQLEVLGVETVKVSPKEVALTADAKAALLEARPKLVIVTEDVATAGTTSATAVQAVRNLDLSTAPRIEVLNTWQRRHHLERLLAIGTVYHLFIGLCQPSALKRAKPRVTASGAGNLLSTPSNALIPWHPKSTETAKGTWSWFLRAL